MKVTSSDGFECIICPVADCERLTLSLLRQSTLKADSLRIGADHCLNRAEVAELVQHLMQWLASGSLVVPEPEFGMGVRIDINKEGWPAMDELSAERIVYIRYRNWKGVISWRTIRPLSISFAPTEWHPVAQWLLLAEDLDKKEMRSFALADVLEWWTTPPEQPDPNAGKSSMRSNFAVVDDGTGKETGQP